jgi:hypothetical protein
VGLALRRAGGDGALFCLDGRYRYALWRAWGDGPSLVVVGLNPSAADERRDDPTIRRCIGFARSFGFARLAVLNLYGLRTAAPSVLFRHPEPVGPHNDEVLRWFVARPDVGCVLAAWGFHGTRAGRGATVARLLVREGVGLECLGTTKRGQPRHPLYVPGMTARMVFAPPAGTPQPG